MGSAFIAQAQRRSDGHQDIRGTQVAASSVFDSARDDGVETARGEVYSPAGAEGLGDDAGAAGAGEGSLAAALWLSGRVMYVPMDGAVPLSAVHDSEPPLEIVSARPVVGQPDWRTLIEQWSDWDADVMLRIMYGPYPCPNGESGGDPNAMSPDGRNWGAYQINVVHGYSVAQMTDPVTSTAIAHDIWLSQGYRAWSCYD